MLVADVVVTAVAGVDPTRNHGKNLVRGGKTSFNALEGKNKRNLLNDIYQVCTSIANESGRLCRW